MKLSKESLKKIKETKEANTKILYEETIKANGKDFHIVLKKVPMNWVVSVNGKEEFYTNFTTFICGISESRFKLLLKNVNVGEIKLIVTSLRQMQDRLGTYADEEINRLTDENIKQAEEIVKLKYKLK